jgi:hypothetical protein
VTVLSRIELIFRINVEVLRIVNSNRQVRGAISLPPLQFVQLGAIDSFKEYLTSAKSALCNQHYITVIGSQLSFNTCSMPI